MVRKYSRPKIPRDIYEDIMDISQNTLYFYRRRFKEPPRRITFAMLVAELRNHPNLVQLLTLMVMARKSKG